MKMDLPGCILNSNPDHPPFRISFFCTTFYHDFLERTQKSNIKFRQIAEKYMKWVPKNHFSLSCFTIQRSIKVRNFEKYSKNSKKGGRFGHEIRIRVNTYSLRQNRVFATIILEIFVQLEKVVIKTFQQVSARNQRYKPPHRKLAIFWKIYRVLYV